MSDQPCDHPQFKISASVQRWGKSDNFRMQAIVFCTACGRQFEFMGLPEGYNPKGAGTSKDKRQIFLAIQVAQRGLILNPFVPGQTF